MSENIKAPFQNSHILIVDDDERIRKLLTKYLVRHGYRITSATDAVHARRLLEMLSFDLVILDVMMPGESGLVVAKYIYEEVKTPVIFLTALGETEDRITGLKTGADDYLPKPFEPQELLLRINTILKRLVQQSKPVTQERIVKIGALQYNFATAEVIRDHTIIPLTTAEASLMELLIDNLQKAVSRHDLLTHLRRPYDEEADPAQQRVIDVQITRLRRKIEKDVKNPVYLKTIRGEGYMLTGHV